MAPKLEKESQISIVSRFLKGQGTWTKEDIKIALFWIKLLLGLVIGISLGFLRIKGFLTGFAIFVGVSVFLSQYWVNNVLNAQDLFGERDSPVMEGLLNGLALMVFTWASIYTVLNYSN
ncbi:hypothetical protein TVAG_402250 [Trichomonas vaginalis G3]|uniref:Rab5-interacting protein n=1 Tax=Trichomonas vaginalis (strain ATCC PRA-98 / G3) TaxID=412133 RepID=A2DHY2_TRIV3|nr:Rab5-interacting protein C20ORF24 family [Trichomonas vaginalis G3]EAY19971.1 hypothetical protein TVAG_402250 [Trichomonas vaginalis G3]KAI5525921.1 Rab5-interacting protein C20ORF24 family [Trichomonas vaginalis G3]|eukprot:XP_001580957.1 hypothetical protein [Trichomonas vaginalis G3]